MGSKKKDLRFLLISIYVITLIINLLGAGFNSYAEEIIVAGSFRTTMDNDISDKTSIQSYTSKEANKDRFENEVPNLYEKYHWEYLKDGNKQYAYFDTEDDLDAYKPLKATVNVYFTLYCNNTDDYKNQTYYKVHVNKDTTLVDVLNKNKGIPYIGTYFRYNTAFVFVKVKKPNKDFGYYGEMAENEKIVEDIILAQQKVGDIGTPPGQGGGSSGGDSSKQWSFYSGVKNYELQRVQVENREAFNDILGNSRTLSSSTSSEQKPVVDNYNKVLDSKPTLYRNWHWSSNQSAASYDKLYFCDSNKRVSEIDTNEFYAAVNVYFTVSTSEGGNRKYYHKHIVRENKFNDIISNFSNEDFFKSLPAGGKWYIIEDCEGVKDNILNEDTEVDKDVILEYRLPTPTPPTRVETPTKPAVETPTKPAVVIPTKPAVETPTKPAVVIPTKPAVETPTKPAVVIPTKPSVETPTEPAVKTPTEPAVAPEPEPTLPVYPIDRLPDPNSPDSPDELVAIDEDGSPLGKYVKRKKPDGKNEYVIEEDLTPQGDTKKPTLPQTGGVPDWLYIALGNAILVYGLLKMKENIKE